MDQQKSNSGQNNAYEMYFQSLSIAFDKFISEERQGVRDAEKGLMKSIKTARTLHLSLTCIDADNG